MVEHGRIVRKHSLIHTSDAPADFAGRILYTRIFAMQRLISRIWTEDDGVLSFEWTLLLTLLTLGIVSGISAARDAISFERCGSSTAGAPGGSRGTRGSFVNVVPNISQLTIVSSSPRWRRLRIDRS